MSGCRRNGRGGGARGGRGGRGGSCAGLGLRSGFRFLPLLPFLVAGHEFCIPAVVFLDVLVLPVKTQSFAILLRCLVELSIRLAGNGEIVVRHGVGGIQVDGTLEAEHRLAPEVHLRHLHAKRILRLRPRKVCTRVRARRQKQQEQGGDGSAAEDELCRLAVWAGDNSGTIIRIPHLPSSSGTTLLAFGAVHAMPELLRDLLIAWSLLPFLNPNRTRLLLEYFDPLASVCNASSRMLEGLLNIDHEQAELVKNPLRRSAADRVSALRDSAVTLADAEYPSLLREIIDPPFVLHMRGNRELMKKTAVAVVGSRRASPYSLNATRHIVAPLAREREFVIVSGLARGIDAAAHEAALDCGGATIAVLGTGIDIVYPRSHKRLFDRIEKDGLIVTEFGPGTPPLASNFPRRNRIISGLSRAAVIVEATGRSGSLITARMAAEQGREVLAVPGSIFAPGSEGTHRLIQYGAKLVHDANDIIDEIPGYARVRPEKPRLPEPPLREVLEVFSREEATHIDTAAAKLGRSVSSIAESLLQLELDGWVQALPGASYMRVK